MKELRLYAMFSHIDQYSRMWFTLLDEHGDDSRAKLERAGAALDGDLFSVAMPGRGAIPADVAALAGRRVSVVVRVQPYSFVSKLERNRGQRVTGVRLTLSDIEPAVEHNI